MGFKVITHEWIKIWLTQRTQRVVVNGHNSNLMQVQSGVPQGTVLGPLMFLLYINDINYGISSHLKNFADDCILYWTINNQQDQLLLWHDLNLIVKWTQTWLMELNTSKCVVLTYSRSTSSSTLNYTIYHKSLPTVCHPIPLFSLTQKYLFHHISIKLSLKQQEF